MNIKIPSVRNALLSGIVYAVLFMWQLPQHIAAGAVALWFTLRGNVVSKRVTTGITVYDIQGQSFGVSLGNFIFIGSAYRARVSFHNYECTCKHEHGHQYQSLMLGPLYLILVGLPSAVFNVIGRFNSSFNKDYFKRYPESWADRLGKVNRA